ncbi:hypothetical protein HMPREF9607_01401 [Cutibacterium modestum HL044PA1]|uniref:Ascorbate-specific PTS system EIIC component n=1 Tax=Cutibacterium modestum HL044PA1 TaxID=765109 RepID=A0ABP2K8Q3_9ACTN|nr:hypothetical protein HMPREF9607_01401 [Cutibacterium modestum HL044PA1]
MSIALAIVQFLVSEILSVPAFLIGIITAVGLAAMRKSVGQIADAAIKATLGFLLIGAGAGLVVNSLGPLGKMIEGALGAHGVVPTNEAIAGIAQQQYGSQVAWIMLAGFLISLLLARITPLHYVFLTGHHMLFMATPHHHCHGIVINAHPRHHRTGIATAGGAHGESSRSGSPLHTKGHRRRRHRHRTFWYLGLYRRCRHRPLSRSARKEPVDREYQGSRRPAVPSRLHGGESTVNGSYVRHHRHYLPGSSRQAGRIPDVPKTSDRHRELHHVVGHPRARVRHRGGRHPLRRPHHPRRAHPCIPRDRQQGRPRSHPGTRLPYCLPTPRMPSSSDLSPHSSGD